MGLTQHREAVATIREIVNTVLLRGSIGDPVPGCARCGATATSRATARWASVEKSRRRLARRACRPSSASTPPRHHGYDTVDAIAAMAAGDVDVFVGLGGNFAAAAPDTDVRPCRRWRVAG